MDALSIYIQHWLIDSNKQLKKKVLSKRYADSLEDYAKRINIPCQTSYLTYFRENNQNDFLLL